jgi:hypothetical protein
MSESLKSSLNFIKTYTTLCINEVNGVIDPQAIPEGVEATVIEDHVYIAFKIPLPKETPNVQSTT